MSRKITECPMWRWRDGALSRPDEYGRTWRWIGGVAVQQDGPRIDRCRPPAEQLAPDDSDPATVGCLLALVREAWCDPLASVIARNANDWEVRGRTERGAWPLAASGASEWDALRAALWAASEREAGSAAGCGAVGAEGR